LTATALSSGTTASSVFAWIALSGEAQFVCRDGQSITLHAGQTVLLPAELGAVALKSDQPLRLLRVTLPMSAR